VFGCPLDTVKEVYNAYPEAIEKNEHLGMACLHLACGGPGPLNLEVIEFLLKMYPDARNVECLNGSRPFQMLCARRHGGDQTLLTGEVMDVFLLKYPELLVTDPAFPLFYLHQGWRWRWW
jgi:hypothetical protein